MWDDGGLGREPAAFNDGFASGAQRERRSAAPLWPAGALLCLGGKRRGSVTRPDNAPRS